MNRRTKRDVNSEIERIRSASEIDASRLAMALDTEGHISISYARATVAKRYAQFALWIDVANTDARLIDWLLSTFGGWLTAPFVSRNPKYNQKRPCFHWRLSSRSAAEALRRSLPYLLMKRQEAEISIQFQNTFQELGKPCRIDEATKAKRHSLYLTIRSIRGFRKGAVTQLQKFEELRQQGAETIQ